MTDNPTNTTPDPEHPADSTAAAGSAAAGDSASPAEANATQAPPAAPNSASEASAADVPQSAPVHPVPDSQTSGIAATKPLHPYSASPSTAPAYGADGYAASPNQATLDATQPPTVSERSARRSLTTPVIVAVVVAALIGGVSGAGVSALALSSNQNSTSAKSSAAVPQNVTVNDTSKVNAVTAVVAKVEPSIVTISVTGTSEAGTGSGIILSPDGYVLTNTHVVTLDGDTSAGTIQVTSSDGHIYGATVVGTDPIVDLAVIKLKNASGLQPAEFANSSKLNVGQTAIAIGAPLGLSNTVTEGIVSALDRSITIASSAVPKSTSSGDTNNGKSNPYDFWNFDNGSGGNSQQQQPAPTATISLPVVQTDAAINPGNSGGALLDSDGKVIGINVAIASAGQTSSSSGQSGSIGVGFAIPSNLAVRVSGEIIKNGSATHGLLGASVSDVPMDGSSDVVGALIQAVSPGGAADKAGLTKGDVVTSFNGMPITGSTDLTAQVRFLPAGASSSLTYVRDGKTSTVKVTLGTLK